MFKVIIAGGRDFSDYEYLKRSCDNILKNKTDIIIISGCADGADKLGEKYAEERGYDVLKFPAPWDDVEGKSRYEIGFTKAGKKYWKKAGPFRNAQMANAADALIAYWDKRSPGTKDMIDKASEKRLLIRIKNY